MIHPDAFRRLLWAAVAISLALAAGAVCLWVPAADPAPIAPGTEKAKPAVATAKPAVPPKPRARQPALSPPEPPDPDGAPYAALFDWVEKDPRAALAWAASLEDAESRRMAVTSTVSKLAENNPSFAVEEATRLLGPKDVVVPSLIQQWATQDVPAALRWVQSQPQHPQKEELMTRIAFAWSQTDPAKAAAFLVNSVAPGPVQDEGVISVLHQWIGQDPEAAADWVQRFPPGPLKERAAHEFAVPTTTPAP